MTPRVNSWLGIWLHLEQLKATKATYIQNNKYIPILFIENNLLLYFTFRNLCLEPEESLLVSGTEGGQILKVESSALEVDQDVLDEESRYILFGLL